MYTSFIHFSYKDYYLLRCTDNTSCVGFLNDVILLLEITSLS